MAGSVNKVILVGNLGKDPEIRRTQDGRPIANLSIATSETWRDKATGERKEKTEWHRVVIFNEGLCKIAEQYLKKGAKVYIEGAAADPQMDRPERRREILDRSGAAGIQLDADHARRPQRRRWRQFRRAMIPAAISAPAVPSSAAPRRAVAAGARATATWTTIFRSERSRTVGRRRAAARIVGCDIGRLASDLTLELGHVNLDSVFGSCSDKVLRFSIGSRFRPHESREARREPCAAARCRSADPAACLCGDGGLCARRGPVCGAKGHIASPDARLDLGGADGGRGHQLVLDPPDPAWSAPGARSICCRSSRWRCCRSASGGRTVTRSATTAAS